MAEPMVRMVGLAKHYGGRRVLRGIDLELPAGECLALLGPNGAGKTTLLRIVATLSRPSAGTVTVDGLTIGRHNGEIRRRIGLLSHQPLLYEDLSPEENLLFFARMYAVPDPPARVAALLERVGLRHRRADPVRTFSRGMRQRLAVARVLLHDPRVLLMDEPYTGLDAQAQAALDALLADEGARGRTVILTTHDLDAALRVAQRAALLAGGKIAHQMARESWDVARFGALYRDAVVQARP